LIEGRTTGILGHAITQGEIIVRRLAFAFLLLFSVASCARPGGPEVKDAWTRDTVGGTANAAVFMTIRSQTPDRLIAASAPIAKKTDLMTIEGGSSAMEMKYLQDIDIPANKSVSLNPTGLHVWLAGLKQPLRAGQTFPLLLKFEKGHERRVVVSVIAPAASPPM
jgi:copper(I)-binding protein